MELPGVAGAIVWRNLHTHQQYLRSRRATGFDDLCQLPLHHIQWVAAQTIIAAQLYYDQLWLMLLQQCRQARQATAGGLTTDARVDHLVGIICR